jgi:ParB family transcriptional regulator, chromosome partitioning protein
VFDSASARPPADRGEGREALCDGRKGLRITETDRLGRPAIDPQQGAFRALKKRFVESHLARTVATGLVQKEIDYIKERHCKSPASCVHIVVCGRPAQSHFPIMAKPALGKGLGALINTRVAAPAPVEELGERIQTLPLDQITPSPLQPRQEFRSEHLHELVDSIRERGIIQPLILRRVEDKYEIIAGERRWRAARELRLTEVPAIIRKASDREVLELALVENLQREDLNPIEEAGAYTRLHRDFGLTQDEISKRVGKSRASIANAMRLLDLEPDAQALLKQGRISVGHAKVLLSLKSHEEQRLLMDLIVRQGASVRATEKLAVQQLARLGKSPARHTPSADPALSPALQRVQNLLTHRLATRVIVHHGEKRGTISIEYYGSDDLNRILGELGIDSE